MPTVFWDGTGATVIWYAPGDAGKWMKVRMTFSGEILGPPSPLAMAVTDPGVMTAAPIDGGLLAVWEQSGGILRCMRVQQDGSSTTNTLATDVMVGPGEAWVSLVTEADGALVAWVDEIGAPTLARVDDACQIVWGPEAPPLPGGEVVLGAPAVAVKGGVILVGWPADDGASEGFHRVIAYDTEGTPGEAQVWQDGPGVVEFGLRLFPKTLGFGYVGLTLGPFGGGVPTPILRDLDKDGIPKAAPSAPIPTPPGAGDRALVGAAHRRHLHGGLGGPGFGDALARRVPRRRLCGRRPDLHLQPWARGTPGARARVHCADPRCRPHRGLVFVPHRPG